jgi:transcriptional regulator with XRE-family HTH domain
VDEAMTRFAANVRTARLAAGLTQEAVGLASGVHPTEISRIEGSKRDPQLSTVLRLARALGVPPARLLDGIA